MLGSPGQRLADATASALILPDLTCGIGTSSGSNAIDTSPETSAGRIGALPLYGTWVILTLDSIAKRSPVRWAELPTPLEPKVRASGCLRP